MNLKVLLVDDHPIFREGLQRILARHPRFSLVGEAATATGAIDLAATAVPDLVLMDIHLPDACGIASTREILRRFPAMKVIILSGDANRHSVDEALQAGAGGYVWKQAASAELIRAIELVMAGRLYLSPELSAGILEDYRLELVEEPGTAHERLSQRDRQLLKLVAEGQRNKEIATHLAISPKSVEAYRSRLMKKLECRSPADLVRYAIREGIATP